MRLYHIRYQNGMNDMQIFNHFDKLHAWERQVYTERAASSSGTPYPFRQSGAEKRMLTPAGTGEIRLLGLSILLTRIKSVVF